jgi:hypothetical protein
MFDKMQYRISLQIRCMAIDCLLCPSFRCVPPVASLINLRGQHCMFILWYIIEGLITTLVLFSHIP